MSTTPQQARKVRPMERGVEDRLLAMLEAVGAPISRKQIFSRLSDDFVDEEDLAKTLGPMVASGRLVRTERPRLGSTPEFVYGVSAAGERTQIIAAAVANVRASVPPKPKPEELKEEAMPKTKASGRTRQRILDYLTPARGWIPPGNIAEELGLKTPAASYHLTSLAGQEAIQAHGHSNARRYAALGVAPIAMAAESAKTNSAPAQVPRKRKKALRRKNATHKARAAARSRNLADFGAPASPGPGLPAVVTRPDANAPAAIDDPKCAIEDSGLFAINDGERTIRLTPKGVEKTIAFLQVTQLVWRKGA